jgi:hypothetical protein
MSSGDFYSAAGGRWEVRAKFPVAKGIGYVFLLFPADGTWPPEIDMAEGRVNGPQVMSTYHWGSANSTRLPVPQQHDHERDGTRTASSSARAPSRTRSTASRG